MKIFEKVTVPITSFGFVNLIKTVVFVHSSTHGIGFITVQGNSVARDLSPTCSEASTTFPLYPGTRICIPI